jgi:hypothetical protein
MEGISAIAWTLGAGMSPDVLASAQGPVYVQSLSLCPNTIQAKGGRRVLSW